jgi:membrane-bound hydrogenase subunit beta
MSNTEKAKHTLESKFPYLKDQVKVQRERRLWTEVPQDKFFEVFDFAVMKQGFSILGTITGLDEGANLGLLYHLSAPDGRVLTIKTKIVKDQGRMKSITGYFPSGAIYEREIIDLLGAEFEGLPAGLSYPLPDDWPAGQHPLRKDWDPSVLDKGKEK